MKILDFFPKPKKVVGYNQYTGKRTAFALKKEDTWQGMMDDINQCVSVYQLQKCRFVWSVKAIDDLWPADWIEAATEEFDKAVEALAAQQAE